MIAKPPKYNIIMLCFLMRLGKEHQAVFLYLTNLLLDKGKPAERRGRKAMGLRVGKPTYDRQAAER